jgi:hypothetical protein
MIMFGRKDLKMFRRKVREDNQIMCEWGFIRIAPNGTESEEITRRVVHYDDTYLLQKELEAERKAQRYEELRVAEEARAKEDNQIFSRTNQLLALDIGGCIATIAKQYENYTSVWEYRCTMDNLIIRTRKGDDATVCFHNSDEMMDDLQRYRWAGFELV